MGNTPLRATPREPNAVELDGFIGEVAHVAYHLGAIRQVEANARGLKHGGS